MNWTPQQWEEWKLRMNNVDTEAKMPGKPIRESALHKQISLECHRRGFIALHGAMNKRTHRTTGEPDFVILAPNGRTVLIEAKTGTGNLSDDQERLHSKAGGLGHTVHVVRSFMEFLEIIKNKEAL